MKIARTMDAFTHLINMSSEQEKALAAKVVQMRKAAGLTQADMCERLEIARGRYGHYETGIRRIPAAMLPRIAEILGCTEADLFGDKPKQKKRGPASRLEQLAERIGKLPRNKQNVILDMVEGALDKAS